MSTNTMEDSLAWLEQETKINATLSTIQEMKTKLNVLSLAVSSIAELNTKVKELKNENETLKNEVIYLKSEMDKNKKPCLTDEEREQLREKATEILKSYVQLITLPLPQHLMDELPQGTPVRFNVYMPKNPRQHPKYTEYQDEYISIGVNYIVKKCKNIEQGIRISNKLSQCLKRIKFNQQESFLSITKLSKFTCFKEYKIVYMALYEMYNYFTKLQYCGMDARVVKPLSDGGFDLYSLEEGLGNEINSYFDRYLG